MARISAASAAARSPVALGWFKAVTVKIAHAASGVSQRVNACTPGSNSARPNSFCSSFADGRRGFQERNRVSKVFISFMTFSFQRGP